MNRKNVYLFKMNTCPHCHELQDLLNKSKIKYKLIDIDEEKTLFDAVIKQTGFEHVPQILINEWDGKSFINSKFVSDFETLDEAVDQIKYVLGYDDMDKK